MKHSYFVKTSYNERDCKVLLKDLTNVMDAKSTEEREQLIQSGVHYSELLPEEKKPTEKYMSLYRQSVENTKYTMINWVRILGELMLNKVSFRENNKPIIVSLARAGIPLGVLIKRYILAQYNIDCSHYAISIIRDKGIDVNAMEYIYEHEVKYNNEKVSDIVFVDGWVGKGVIKEQLEDAVKHLCELDNKWQGLSSDLFVISDPAYVTEYCATREDVLLPFACLNSTISGLLSRTILNSYINKDDMHGAVYFSQYEDIDETNKYIDGLKLEKHIKELRDNLMIVKLRLDDSQGMKIVNKVCESYGIQDYKKVKPGIGETTRVLLRRVPYKVLINESIDSDNADIQHIIELCKEKGVSIERFPLGAYKVCGIIKELSADA